MCLLKRTTCHDLTAITNLINYKSNLILHHRAKFALTQLKAMCLMIESYAHQLFLHFYLLKLKSVVRA